MARNKMEDLRDHLFAQLERLSDESLTPAQLEKECQRAEAIKEVAGQLIQSAKVEVDFVKATGMIGPSGSKLFSTVYSQKTIE